MRTDDEWRAATVEKANDLGLLWTGVKMDCRIPEDWRVLLRLAVEKAPTLIDWADPLQDRSSNGCEMLETVVAVAAENIQEWDDDVATLDEYSRRWWKEMTRRVPK